ncbi:MAG TPA: biopolymer transporter ExbD [Candidatus Brocadiia bacterium]|nr:biopolymer transporter ExbD [Candidatus Brocadiia bacterium]
MTPAFQSGRRFHTPKPRLVTINVTSLVDVLFLLLIFILLSTTFKARPMVKVDLPRAGKAPIASAGERITLAISSDGAYHLEGGVIARKDLAASLSALRQGGAVDRLSVEVDRAAPAEALVFALDAARAAGYKQIIVPTVHERN